MPENISSVNSSLSNQSITYRNHYNQQQYVTSDTLFKNDQNNPNQADNQPYFARVNTNRQSIVKNENDLWSNQQLFQPESNIYTITLINGNQQPGPLGIHVIPTFESNTQKEIGLTIQRIEPTGRVHRDGRLKTGDRIIEINKRNLIGYDFIRCQEILRDALVQSSQTQNGILEFKIVRSNIGLNFEPDDNDEKEHEVIELEDLNTEDKNTAKEGHNFKPTAINLGALNTKKIGTKINIQLKKGPEGLGFKLSARDNCTPGEYSPIYIKNILPVGAAITDGRLQRGDRLLEVNQIDMTQKTLHEAVNILRNTKLGDCVEIVVSRQVIEETETTEKIEKIPNENPNPKREKLNFKISLNDLKGLGVNVKGKTKRLEESENLVDLGIYVKSILDGGAAFRDGRLKPNDQIININGFSLLGKTNDEAMLLVKDAMQLESEPGFIEITISRKIKREESMSPKKNGLYTSQKINGKSGESGDVEQFSRFNRDAPSRRSVSEKRAKLTSVPSTYATYGRQRNQSLNEQNKRYQTSQASQPITLNYTTQTLGRVLKNPNVNSENMFSSSQNEYLVPQNTKSVSMESIPMTGQYNVKKLNDLSQNKFGTISGLKTNILNKKTDKNGENFRDIEMENSVLNRCNPKNRSFLTAVTKSIDKNNTNDSTIIERLGSCEKINVEIKSKKTSDTHKHKSLIGKFQNLFKSSNASKKNQSDKIEKFDETIPKTEISKKTISNKKTNETNTLSNNKIDTKIKDSAQVQNDILIENDTLYTQYVPSIQLLTESVNNQSYFANRDSVYYQSIDNNENQKFLLEQQKILREKQKLILEQQQQKFNIYQEVDARQSRINRNTSISQQYRPYLEPSEKIQFSMPFSAGNNQNGLISELIPDLPSNKYYSETASTTSSVISTSSSAYTSSSITSDSQQPSYFTIKPEITRNYSQITQV
ncbi:unnamed protein product [Brachionus calyciflorus]|uniref:PDZ domain-containing protein n=1 Tax=Brachionus calyciflorus TaxID=104777 RepID=A0A814GWS2_9BILA|nr:unnamed protein product [Brachionus calyciflorus]